MAEIFPIRRKTLSNQSIKLYQKIFKPNFEIDIYDLIDQTQKLAMDKVFLSYIKTNELYFR